MIELRLDFLARAPDFKRLLNVRACPLVATVRRQSDGGRYTHPEEERQMLLRQAIVAGFDWIDLETDIADQVRRYKEVKRIISYHNLRETPADLEQIHETMCKQDADVVKLAVTATKPQDNLRVLRLVKDSAKPTVAFCMGDLGTSSRILGAKFGSPFTYAAFNKERGIAPGLPSFDELHNLYCYERIGPETAVYGVAGDPIGHSLSPLIHNKALRQLNLDAVYVPFRVQRSLLPAFLASFEAIGLRGLSVTIPQKEAAATVTPLTDDVVPRIGAANTLVHSPEGWKAYNTDAQAALESLLAHVPESPEGPLAWLKARSVLLLGAGGAARALAFVLSDKAGMLTVTSRTPEHAAQLASQASCRVVDWAARHNVLCDLVINCTPVGMFPNVDESPLHASFLRPELMVFDIVYTPETTLLVKEARARGCHVLTGVDMFVRQAALQFRLFTGQEPPLELMTQVVRRILSPVALRDEDEAKPAAEP